MLFGKKKIKLTKDDILNSIPLKNESLDYARNEQGETVITIFRKKTWWLRVLSIFFYFPDSKTLILDELGTEVLKMCDNKLNFGAMLDMFCRKHKLSAKEAETSIMAYLKLLSERGIIAFAIKEND